MVMRIKEVRPRDDEFTPGQPVRLLVAYLAWVHREGRESSRDGSGPIASHEPALSDARAAPPAARFLSTGDALYFVRYGERPGSCVVKGRDSDAYLCPVGFLGDAGAE
jgi:hypothetical protein